MTLSTWPDTGSVASWLAEMNVSISEVLGWGALYWDGSGSVNSADVFTSVATPWSVHVTDPETLPTAHMQAYLVMFRRVRHVYTIWLDGYDTYSLIDKTAQVTGTLLTDQKWAQMQSRIRAAWEKRGVWMREYSDWECEAPE